MSKKGFVTFTPLTAEPSTPTPKAVHTPKKKASRARPVLLSYSMQDQIMFAKRLAIMLRSGMPIMKSLNMLAEESASSAHAYLYGELISHVETGQPLSTGLAKLPKFFGTFGISVVRVGETSGTLPENLEYLAGELKKGHELRRKVIGSLIYPALIVVATIAIAVMLTVFIFPKILPIFKEVKATLPLSTRILMAISHFLTVWGWWVFWGLVVVVVGFLLLLRIEKVRRTMDGLLLRVPLFGKLSQYYNLANMCRTLSLLLKSGAPIVQSAELVASGISNRVYRNALVTMAHNITTGEKLSAQLNHYPKLFPATVYQMVHVGESTGTLSTTLGYLSELYEEEINELTKNLTTLIEPVLMITMGLIVGFIAISIVTPIYSITQSLTPH